MAYVKFKAISKKGKVYSSGSTPCFSGLRNFNLGVGMLTKGTWTDINKDPLYKIRYKPNNSSGLSDKILNFYYDYLYNHNGWRDLIYNKNILSIEESGIDARCDVNGSLLLAVLSAYRNIDELPKMVSSFYYMCSLDYVNNKDIAFYMSHFVHVTKNGTMYHLPSSDNYNTNHLMFNYYNHSILDGIKYASSFPYTDKTEYLPKFTEDYVFGGTYEYFKFSESVKDSIYYKFKGMYKSNDDTIIIKKFKKLILKMQFGVEDIKKCQKI